MVIDLDLEHLSKSEDMLNKATQKYMCVSDHMGLQNRVGRSGFFFAISWYCP